MADGGLGLLLWGECKLASADLDFARVGRRTFRNAARAAPRDERAAPRAQRSASVLAGSARDRALRTKPGGGASVRDSSHQRGIGGVGGRAQECAEHFLLLSDARRLWLVCSKAIDPAVRRGAAVFRLQPDGEADAGHAAVCSVATGLLASGAPSQQEFILEPDTRKDSALCAVIR